MEQIVFITGYGDIPTGIGAMKRGAVDFLPKPFRDDESLAAVAQALARSAEHWKQRGEAAESRAHLAKLTPREFEVLTVGHRWATEQADRGGTRCRSSYDQNPSQPHNAKDGRSLGRLTW